MNDEQTNTEQQTNTSILNTIESNENNNSCICFECDEIKPNCVLVDNNYICEDCLKENYYKCYNCGEYVYKNDCVNFDNSIWCSDCYNDNTNICCNCGETFYSDDINYCERNEEYYCNDCYPSENDDNDEQQEDNFDIITIPFQKVKSQTYNINKDRRFCGIEIETLNNDRQTNQFNRDDLNKFQFSQISDGSLSNGIEFTSNAFNGDLLFNNIDLFCNELQKKEFYIKRDCGLHIHLAISNKNRLDILKKCLMFYSKYETQFFNMVSKSRQNNHYCNKIFNVYSNLFDIQNKNLLTINDINTFKQNFYLTSKRYVKGNTKHKYNNKRYCWINLHSVFHRGTLEVRLHNGTIDSNKINNWIAIHLRVLDFLNNNNLKTIELLPNTDEFFLSIFEKPQQDYINSRWFKFKPPIKPLLNNLEIIPQPLILNENENEFLQDENGEII